MLEESITYAIARSTAAAYTLDAVRTLGENLKALIESDVRFRGADGKVNFAAFARAIGKTPQTLNGWMGGRYLKLRLDNLLKLSKGLGLPIDVLLHGVDKDYDKIVGRERDLPDHDQQKRSPAADSQPQGGEHGQVVVGAAPSRVQQSTPIDPLTALADVAQTALRALHAHGVTLSFKDEGTRKTQRRRRRGA